MKSIIFFLLLSILWVALPADFTATAAENEIKLYVDGRHLTELSTPPVIVADRTLVPARDVFESLGAVVDWHAPDRAVLIAYEEQLIVLTIDNPTATVNGEPLAMSVPPQIINDRTMIPVRFPAESLGFEVLWVPDEPAVYISTPAAPSVTATPMPNEAAPTPTISSGMDVIPLPNDENPTPTDAPQSQTPTPTPLSVVTPPPLSQPSETEALARDVSTAPITKAEFPLTSITALLSPGENMTGSYGIVASSAISEVNSFLLDGNRLVIDIYHAKHATDSVFTPDATLPVREIRASQFMDVPKVTRFVFAIIGAVDYSVSLSADRTIIYVTFTHNEITSVTFSSDGSADAIYITGTSLPSVQIFPQTQPNRLSVQIDNAVMRITEATAVEGAFARYIGTYQQDESTACVEVLLEAFSSYETSSVGNTLVIHLYPRTYRNLTYDWVAKTIRIPKEPGLPMQLNDIVHQDHYTDYQYILTLPVNMEPYLGLGELIIQDGYINSIVITAEPDGRTRLVINEAQVLAFDVYEDDQFYYIKAMLPREKYARIVVIDPGHGGTDPGTMGNGLVEKAINLNVALKVIQLLEADGFIKAYATRLTDVTFLRDDRPVYANQFADMFVSIHHNAMSGNTAANGTETYYYPHDNDAALGFTSKQLADNIHKHLLSALGFRDRKVQSNNYTVLEKTTIPAVLCEIGFVTNAAEASKLAMDEYQWLAANAIYRGITESFQQYTPKR